MVPSSAGGQVGLAVCPVPGRGRGRGGGGGGGGAGGAGGGLLWGTRETGSCALRAAWRQDAGDIGLVLASLGLLFDATKRCFYLTGPMWLSG